MAKSSLVASFRVLTTKSDGDYAANIALPLAQEVIYITRELISGRLES